MQNKTLFLWTLLLMFCITKVGATDFKHLEEELSDAMITTKITAKYTEQQNLNPLKVNVMTENGHVTLKGHVKDKKAMMDALLIAKSTIGVKSINAEHLEIKDVNTAMTDSYITAKVETAVLKAKVLDDESIPIIGINATTQNGVVTLSGDVKQSQSIQPLLQRVLAVDGVKKVISKLKVNPNAS